MWNLVGPAGTFGIIVVILIISGIKIMKEYQRAVIFRLGRMVAARGPGIIYVIPLIEKMIRVDLRRTVTMDIPPQDVITRDNVSVKVSAVLYFRVLDPNRAIREVENYLFATSQLAQVTLRSVCGQAELDELLAERDKTTLESKPSWMPRLILGESRSSWWSSSTLICHKRCSGLWLSRPRRRGSGGRRSFTRRESFRLRRNWPMQPRLLRNIPWPYNSDSCKVWSRYPQRRKLYDYLSGAPRPIDPVSEEK